MHKTDPVDSTGDLFTFRGHLRAIRSFFDTARAKLKEEKYSCVMYSPRHKLIFVVEEGNRTTKNYVHIMH